MKKLAIAMLMLTFPVFAQQRTGGVRVAPKEQAPVAGQSCSPASGDTVIKIQGSDVEYYCSSARVWVQVPLTTLEDGINYNDACDSEVDKGLRVSTSGARYRCDSATDTWIPTTRQGRQVLNVLDFGAVGGDSSDDSAAFIAALDQILNNGVLYVPEGEYEFSADVDHSFDFLSSVEILCDRGAVLKPIAAGVKVFDFTSTYLEVLTVRDCTFTDDDAAAHEASDQAHGLSVVDVDEVVIRGVYCNGWGDECIDIVRADRVDIQGVVADNNQTRDGAGGVLGFNQCSNVTVKDTKVTNTQGGAAFRVEQTDPDADESGFLFDNVYVKDSLAVTGTPTQTGDGITFAPNDNWYTDVQVINSTFINVANIPINIVPQGNTGITNVIVDNNKIIGGGTAVNCANAGVERGAINLAEGVRNGAVTGNTIRGWGVRDADCVAQDDPYDQCVGPGDKGACVHSAIRVGEDGFTVGNNRISDTPRGIVQDGDWGYECTGGSILERCGTATHCNGAGADCSLQSYNGNIYEGNTITDFDDVGIAPRATDTTVGNTISNGDKGIVCESQDTIKTLGECVIADNTINNATTGLKLKALAFSSDNKVLNTTTGATLSTSTDRCSYSGADCDGGGTCSNDGTCEDTGAGTCEPGETCTCNGGWNDTGSCTEDWMCEEGTCTAVSGPADYENLYRNVATTRINSAGTDGFIREITKHWTQGNRPNGDETDGVIISSEDDFTRGFTVGSRWYRTLSDNEEEWVLLKDTPAGQAVWKKTTLAGTVVETNNVITSGSDTVITSGSDNVVHSGG